MVVERELAGVVRIDDSIAIRIQKPHQEGPGRGPSPALKRLKGLPQTRGKP